MTVAVSHWTRSPGVSVSVNSHTEDYEGMAYSEVQFSVESMDEDKDGSGGQSHLPWDEGAAEMTGGGGSTGGSANDVLLFEEFVDLERLSTSGGDELPQPGLPDSLLYNMPLPAHGPALTSGASDDPRLDDLVSYDSQSQAWARKNATAGPAARVVPSAAAARVASSTSDAVVPPAVDIPGLHQSSWSIDREEGQRKASTYPDTACAGGSESISDSELLRLEGISLKASPSRAPSVVVSHPPTPLLQASSATSNNSNHHLAGSSSTNNTSSRNDSNHNGGTRKPSNFFKVVASKLQQKAASVRHKQPNMSSLAVDTSRGPLSPNVSPRKAFKLRPEQLGLGGQPQPNRLPLSPPNSATIPQDLPSNAPVGSNGMPFCGGYVEDPFFDTGVAGGSVPMFRRSDPTTPMDTPVLDDKSGMFYHHQQMSTGNVANTSKATWPMTTTPQADTHVAWSSAYTTADALDNQWWDGSGIDLSSNSQYQAQNARNATFNLAMHTQHSELPYEYNSLAAAGPEMSGLMIHMPQPRGTSSPIIAYQPQQQLHHQQHPQQMTERRPRMPRAPSAGARHMCLSTPMRKTRNPSRTRQNSRESSTSPTPTNRSRHSSGGSLASLGGGPALGASVKKRRSWSRREGGMRTPSMGSGLGGASEGVGFVNFTPSDKNILMTGVAPSGSSKTKARREKEAMEKRRRLSEAAIKAVKAAGGDVDKLVEEGFVF
ncbi:Regulatory protein wetA [Colletotrichum chlorophyti]|uniref:Regulatory protein wetA n=1 Tax=Colletotrichum chlorophyti TaxID=708187 RepID=A0A1Q8RMS8_9PEZI|nr:Regulatory protein wetA [Colletotrichum chlorophyti]